MDVKDSALPALSMAVILLGILVILAGGGIAFLCGAPLTLILWWAVLFAILILAVVVVCMVIDLIRCVLLPPPYRGKR